MLGIGHPCTHRTWTEHLPMPSQWLSIQQEPDNHSLFVPAREVLRKRSPDEQAVQLASTVSCPKSLPQTIIVTLYSQASQVTEVELH